jgi:hypothetical protein
MGMQVLYPIGKINIVILSTFVGAVTNLLFNVLLIPRFGHYGTATAYMLAEVFVTISMFFMGRKYIPIKFFKKQHFNYIVGSIIMGLCLYFIASLNLSNIATLIFMVVVGVIVYAVTLLLLKDPIEIMIMELLKTRLVRK